MEVNKKGGPRLDVKKIYRSISVCDAADANRGSEMILLQYMRCANIEAVLLQ